LRGARGAKPGKDAPQALLKEHPIENPGRELNSPNGNRRVENVTKEKGGTRSIMQIEGGKKELVCLEQRLLSRGDNREKKRAKKVGQGKGGIPATL